MSLYAFGFSKNNITTYILYNLNSPDMVYQIFPNNIEHFLKIVRYEKPTHLLGIGVYTGVDSESMRIENTCKNQFRNEQIDKKLPKNFNFSINYFIEPGGCFKLATAMGNSYCNLVSYKIMNLINKENLVTRFTFLHIPKTFNKQLAVEQISSRIDL